MASANGQVTHGSANHWYRCFATCQASVTCHLAMLRSRVTVWMRHGCGVSHLPPRGPMVTVSVSEAADPLKVEFSFWQAFSCLCCNG